MKDFTAGHTSSTNTHTHAHTWRLIRQGRNICERKMNISIAGGNRKWYLKWHILNQDQCMQYWPFQACYAFIAIFLLLCHQQTGIQLVLPRGRTVGRSIERTTANNILRCVCVCLKNVERKPKMSNWLQLKPTWFLEPSQWHGKRNDIIPANTERSGR